jgi:hypothetical protein
MTPQGAVEKACADLLAHGYVEIEGVDRITPGARVHHCGERYSAAYLHGTAQVAAVFEKDPSPWAQSYGRRDIEVVVVRDRPLLDGMDLVHTWADYHTVPTENARSLDGGDRRG